MLRAFGWGREVADGLGLAANNVSRALIRFFFFPYQLLPPAGFSKSLSVDSSQGANPPSRRATRSFIVPRGKLVVIVGGPVLSPNAMRSGGGGIASAIDVSEGEQVKTGQLLVKIDVSIT